MKQFVISVMLGLLLLVGCGEIDALPTEIPVAQLPTIAPTAQLPTAIPTTLPPTITPTTQQPTTPPELLEITNTPHPPANTPVPISTVTPLPTLRPTSTAVLLDPSLPMPTGRIYFLWDSNQVPEIRGIGEVSETNLYEAVPGDIPDDWQIEPVIEMIGHPFMRPSPDSSTLAIIRYDDTNGDGVIEPRGSDIPNIYSYSIANSSMTKLTENQWSPGIMNWLSNAQALTYSQLNDLHVIEIDNPLHSSKLVSYSGTIYNHSWSPDGRYLVSIHASSQQSAHPGGTAILDIFDSENNEFMAISDTENSSNKIFWSQNSLWVSFSRNYGSHDQGLRIIDVTTSEIIELLSPDSYASSEWSPHEAWLAFTDGSTLSLWDAKTKSSKQLAAMASLSKPSWSPNDNNLAVGYTDGEQAGLLFIDAITGNQTKLDLGMFVNNLIWSPDGEWLLFSSGMDGRVGLYMVHKDGSTPFLFLETTGGWYPYDIYWLPE